MNLRPTAVFAMLGGIVLLYAAVKNMYPQDVIRKALGKDAIHGPIYKGASTGDKPAGTTTALSPATGVPVVSV